MEPALPVLQQRVGLLLIFKKPAHSCRLVHHLHSEMSLLSVCVRGQWFRVPRGGPPTSVHALGVSALRRYRAAGGRVDGEEEKVRFSLRRCCSGELLHPQDELDDVLADGDFVQMGAYLQSTSDGGNTLDG